MGKKNSKFNKAIVTQDNRFIFAKYDMNTNELKFFMWIIAQINSQKDQLFQICEIPVKEIFEVLEQKSETNYTYIRQLCESMLKKTYIEDYRMFDKTANREVRVFQGYTLFEEISYKEGDAVITYKLNDTLTQYLLKLERNFTQLEFKNIRKMRSSYAIRIYNMLYSQLKQNRLTFEIVLETLNDSLQTPKSIREKWGNFKTIVLDRAIKDINKMSDIFASAEPIKQGKKVVAVRFEFDYKGSDRRTARIKKTKHSFLKNLAKELDPLVGKRIYFGVSSKKSIQSIKDKFGSNENLRIEAYEIRDDGLCLKIGDEKNKVLYNLNSLEDFSQINYIRECVEFGEKLFYADEGNIKDLKAIIAKKLI